MIADLEFLQELSEAQFSELVFIPLLTRMGYSHVRFTHGPDERGKDIVFAVSEPLAGQKFCAVVIKKEKLSGAASGSRSLRETLYQVQESFDAPFVDPLDGTDRRIDTVYVVTPFPVTQQAIASARHVLSTYGSRVRFIDGPALVDLIRRYYPSLISSLPASLPLLRPKRARSKAEPVRAAFVVMPFKNPFDTYYPAIFKPALEEAGFVVTRADDVFAPRPVIRDIQEAIRRTDLVLCEMTERNPNVFYELGLAHAIGKPAILVSSAEEDVPFDLRHIRIISYNYRLAGWEAKLRREICSAAKAVSSSAEVWPPPLDGA